MRTPDPYQSFECDPNTGCWLWYLATSDAGYGSFREAGRTVLAHRKFYERARGPIPRGLHVCHKCDTPQCVNPDHLFLGTPSDNMTDMHRKGRWAPRDLKVGARHPLARLTPGTLAEIRTSAESTKALALRYGVSPSCVNRARRGATYPITKTIAAVVAG